MKIISKSLIITLFCCLVCVGCEKESEKELGTEEESNKEEELGAEEEEISIDPPTYTLIPDAQGGLGLWRDSAAMFKPGDVIYLRGTFEFIWIDGLNGSAEHPIVITNYPGEQVVIGNSTWSGGGGSHGISMSNCHHFILGGENSASDFLINGSTSSVRYAYFNLVLRVFTDNAEIKNITLKNGGTGIWAKTDPDPDDPDTWYPNTYMENLYIHDVIISGTGSEGMYIGHTATWWDFTTHTPFYDSPSDFVPGNKYVQPIKWKNVKISNCYLYDIGCDGIQASAIDGLEICYNEVTDWATEENPSHNGGILINGRTTNTNTHDNYVHDGWGEMCQFYGSGENNATHIIHNNLFRDNQWSDGLSLRGTEDAVVQITNNTIARCGNNLIRLNGYFGMEKEQIIKMNVLIEPRMEEEYFDNRAYIYIENNASATEGTGTQANVKIRTVEDAKVNVDDFYQPVSGSPIGNAGYRK